MELRAGAIKTGDVRSLDKLFAAYSNSDRIIALSGNLYLKAGEIIQKVNKKYGGLSRGFSHVVLIALSAASIGATLFTSNKNDFDKIAEFLTFRSRILI